MEMFTIVGDAFPELEDNKKVIHAQQLNARLHASLSKIVPKIMLYI